MTDSYLQMMKDSLAQKISIMQDLEKLTEEQKELFLQGNQMDDEAFQHSLDQKGELIDELLKLDDGFTSLFDNVKAEIGDDKQKYAADIKEIQELIHQVSDLSASLEAGEKRNKQLAEKYFRESREQIKQGKQASGTAITYYQTMSKNQNVRPQFFDSKK